MTRVRLRGRLICTDDDQVRIIEQELPRHVELTRAEDGCDEFSVEPSGEAGVWMVQERFRDAEAFAAHQARVAASAWGRETAGIRRDYEIDGLPTES